MGFLDKVCQHLFRDGEVGDDTVLHRPDSDDVAGRAAKHILSFLANGLYLVCHLVDGDNGRLIDNDAATFGIDQSIGCTQIYCQITGKQTKQRAKIHGSI